MTTVLTEAPIEVAGRRLNPGTSPEWQHLLTHFELSEGFSFVVLLVPDADWANACRIALSQYLEAEGKNLLTVGYSDTEDFKIQVPGRLLALHTSEHTGAVRLEAVGSKQQASSSLRAWQSILILRCIPPDGCAIRQAKSWRWPSFFTALGLV